MVESKIKILMIVPNLFVANGVASFVMNYLRNIDHYKFTVDVLSYKNGESIYYDEVKKYGGKVIFLPSIKNLISHTKECNKILENGKYDIVHDNTLHISLPLMWCAKRNGVSIRILHSHSTKMGETPYKEFRNKVFLPALRKQATNYVACSKWAGEAMFKNNYFDILPNVIETEKYIYDENIRNKVRKIMGVEEKCVIATVGRLAEQKNPFFAVDVFEKLINLVPNAEYWWIGNGSLDIKVREYIESKKLTNHIKLLGSRNDVIELYQAMDCFFLPSLFEGLPLTGVEAQAMGLPVVVSDTVTDEMVYTDLVDFVSLNDSIDLWAEHLEMACEKKSERKKYKNELISSNFSDIKCINKLMDLYWTLYKMHGGV